MRYYTTGGRGLPLAQCRRKLILVETLNDVAITRRTELVVIDTLLGLLHFSMYWPGSFHAHNVQGGGRPPRS